MSKWVKRVLSAVLVCALVGGAMPMAAYADGYADWVVNAAATEGELNKIAIPALSILETISPEPKKLLVLGDSIAVGMFALPTFPAGFNPYAASWDSDDYPDGYAPLVAQEMGYELTNLAVSGDETIHLLTKLKTNQPMRQAVGEADIIEISIGGNDILNAANKYPMDLISDLKSGIYTTVDKVFADAKKNMGDIISEIRILNPGAVLVIQNIYDMGPNGINDQLTIMKNSNFLYALLIGSTTVSEAYWTGMVQRGNKAVFTDYLTQYPNAFILADVYSRFNWKEDLMSPDYVHPNKAGHEVIAGAVLNALRTIDPTPPTIVTTALQVGSPNVRYNQKLAADGSGAITWSMAGGALPNGLTLASDGTIQGMSSQTGVFNFTVRAQNSFGADTKAFSLELRQAYAVTVTSAGNGTARASLSNAAAGAVIVLTATPNSGYRFKEWQVTGGGPLAIEDNRFTMPVRAVSVRAVFELIPPTYNITVTSGGNGTASANPANAVAGTVITLSATPNTDCRFSRWQVVSGGPLTITDNKFIMPARAVSITAYFEQLYNITVTSDGNGTASASETSAFPGTPITLTATPAEGYRFLSWTVVSGGPVTITNNRFNMQARACTIRANFEPIPTYAITVTNDGNGTASANPANAQAGTTITLTATPADGYQFKEWEVISGDVTITDNKFTMPERAVEVKATFELIPYDVTVTNDGNGTASANPANAVAGTTITLTATPADGYQFKEWEVISGDVTIIDNKFTMPERAVEVKAIFELIPYDITVTNDGNGTASANPANAQAGTTITLTATPKSGYQFKAWQVVSGGVTIIDNKFTMPAQAVEVKAIFELILYDVTVTNDGNGTASANPANAQAGTTITLTATPKSGYQFKAWQVVSGDVTISANKFTMPAQAVEVKAIFELIPPTIDKTALNTRINQIGNTQKGNHTNASWNAFQSALHAAQLVADNPDATQVQVDSALNALNAAFNNLQLKKMIFNTRYESSFWNWMMFFLLFGWIWMWL